MASKSARSGGVAPGKASAASPGNEDGSRPPAGSTAVDGPFHDILFVSQEGQFFRFPVNKGAGPEEPGTYRCPVAPPFNASGTRHVRNVAGPNDDGPPRGPILATLPITPEPGAASTITCYVINAQNLRYENPYIVEEWASAGAEERHAPVPDGFTLLIAGPKGDIYQFSVEGSSGPKVRALSDEELKVETDIWQSLRNGTVVGRVLFQDRVVPLVNVTSALVD